MENDVDVLTPASIMAKAWWLWILFGVAWVIISLVVLQFNTTSVKTVGVIIGIFFLVASTQNLMLAAVVDKWKWVWILFSMLFMVAGIWALVFPKNTFAAVADTLGFLFLLAGIYWIIESFSMKKANELWWLNLIAGILMVILAFWTSGQFFITRAYTLITFTGVYAMLKGITDIVKAFEMRRFGRLIVG